MIRCKFIFTSTSTCWYNLVPWITKCKEYSNFCHPFLWEPSLCCPSQFLAPSKATVSWKLRRSTVCVHGSLIEYCWHSYHERYFSMTPQEEFRKCGRATVRGGKCVTEPRCENFRCCCCRWWVCGETSVFYSRSPRTASTPASSKTILGPSSPSVSAAEW